MKPAAKDLIFFSLFFCVVIATEEEKQVSEENYDDINDYRRLQYLSDCRIMKLKPGDYELLSDETLKVEAYNLTLNKTFFDVSNDSVTICKPQYFLTESETNSLIFPPSASVFSLLICLLLFVTHDYSRLYWTIFLIAFSFYTVNTLSGFVQSCFQSSQTKFAHELHFLILQLFFWLSTIACDALLLSPIDGTELSRRSSGARASTFKLRQVINLCSIRLLIVFISMAILNVTGIWPPDFRVSSLSNYIRIVTIYVFVSTFNMASLEIFLRMNRSVEVEQKTLKEIFLVCFLFFNITVIGWYLEYYFSIRGMDFAKRFTFQIESGMVYIFIAAAVVNYYYNRLSDQEIEEAAILQKEAKQIKVVKVTSAPKHQGLQMA